MSKASFVLAFLIVLMKLNLIEIFKANGPSNVYIIAFTLLGAQTSNCLSLSSKIVNYLKRVVEDHTIPVEVIALIIYIVFP